MADGPVIVSSNPFGDIKPYCGRIYHSEPDKWGDILPWEFPQNASRADEEAFLRNYFTDSEIYSRGGAFGEGLGFRFLKQVWYCIALWNLNHKIPAIVDEWFQQNQELVNDPGMVKHICKDDASLDTFGFTTEQQKLYGEKILNWVIKNIQYKVKHPAGEQDAKQPPPSPIETAAEPAAPVTDSVLPKTSPETVRQPEGSRSAVVSNASLSVPESTPKITNSVPGSSRTTERFPDASWNASQSPASAMYSMGEGGYMQQPSRARGNSNNNRRYGGNTGPGRSDPRQNQPYQTQMYGASPHFNTVVPSIGDVRMHPMLNPARYAYGGPPDFGLPPQYVQQQMPQQMHPMHHMPGDPAPSGPYGNTTQQQYGPPFPPPPQEMHMAPTGFAPSSQPNPYYNSQAAMNDRSNERYNNRNFSDNDPFPTAEDASYRRGPGKRRDSEVSRGDKTRGGYTSGRGRGSRGRNSFTGPRPQQELFTGDGQFKHNYRQQSGEYEFQAEPYHANRNRRGSTNSQSWRSKNERPQVQQDENQSSGRIVSGPGYGAPGPVPGMSGVPPPGLPPPGLAPPGFNGSVNRPWERNDRQTIAVQPSRPTQPSFPQNHATGAIHDERDPRANAFPGKLLTKTNIGVECGYVRKVVVFDVPDTVTDLEISKALGAGTFENLNRRRGLTSKDGSQHVYVLLDNHLAARTALSKNRTGTIGGRELRVEVPREYWDPEHSSYPGYGAPWTHSNRSGSAKQARQPEEMHTAQNSSAAAAAPQENERPTVNRSAASLPEEPVSGDSTPTAKSSADDKKLKELLSGDTTPTASGASTPNGTIRQNKNNKKNKKMKKQQQPGTHGEALQAAFAKHQRTESGGDHADARSDTSTATVVRATPTKDAKVDKVKQASVGDEDTKPTQLVLDTDRKASVQSDDAQTKSEPTFSPELQMTAQFPKVSMPQAEKAAEYAKKADEVEKTVANTVQPFHGPPKAQRTAASEEAGTMNSKATDKLPHHNAGGKANSKPGVEETVDVIAQPAPPSASVSPQKSEDDQADESFHTANGSPHGSSDGRKKEDRASEESNDTAVTAIYTPGTTGETNMSETNDDKSIDKAVGSPQASPKSPASPKTAKKAPVPLPKIKVAEPVSVVGRSDDKVDSATQSAQRSASGPGLSVPPTPAFETAPSTPAMPSSAEKVAPIVDKPQLAKKAEKVKGPAQTESVSVFGKKPKPKKSKPIKGEGSGKVRTDAAGRSFSDATNDSFSRVVSGATTPSMQPDEQPEASQPANDETADAAATMQKFDSKRPSNEETAATGLGVEKDTAKSKAESASDANAEADTATAPASAQSRSQSKSRGVVDSVINLFRSSQPAQPATPETKMDKSSSQPEPADSNAQGTQMDHQIELAALHETHTKVDEADIEAEDRPVAPVAQMVPPADDAGSTDHTEQPFRSFRDSRDNDGVRDSGDSGGRAAHGADGDIGLGIGAGGDDVLETDGKPKKKKKKKSKSKKKKGTADGSTDQVDESVDATPDTDGPSPFAFEFKANSHPTPSDDVLQTPTGSLRSVSDVASNASSHTAGRSSSREQTPTSASVSVADSPARNMIAKKIARGQQGPSHLVEAPTARPTKKKRFPSSAKASEAATSAENDSNTIVLHAETDSGDEVSGHRLDEIMDKSMAERSQNQKRSLLYMYVGPGKRNQESGWEGETTEEAERKFGEAAARKLGTRGNDENARPETTATRKGG
ncbi:hypothetical protein LTR85_009858 [Meristemomyces frigidus]|nr:hypothetical protein LTR85_009858 [Meristemomyces frigidus]